jgi:hypothetical protein
MLKSEIERTTTDDVIGVGTSQVKLSEEFNGSIVIDDQVDAVMEDVTLDRGEEKTDKVVDSKYLQPRWCPPGLTRTQKRKLQRLRLAEMREKEREKRQDELFNEIKPVTLPKQEWRGKGAPLGSMADLAASGQTTTPNGQTARAQEAHGLSEDQAGPTAAPSSQHTEAGGQTMSPGSRTTSSYSLLVRSPAPTGQTVRSCGASTSDDADGNSSPAAMEEDTDDDLLDYEPSPTHDGMVWMSMLYIYHLPIILCLK